MSHPAFQFGYRFRARPLLFAAVAVAVGPWLACLTPTTTCGDDWLQFRGPSGLGSSSETNLPTTWNDTQNLQWKAELPGSGSSSPIVLGDRIYVTCYSGYGIGQDDSGSLDDLMLHLVCLQASDGTIVWSQEIKPRQPESDRVRDHGYAAATPATDGEFLYVFFGKTGVFKFDLQGNKIWSTTVGDRTHGWGSGTSPVLYDGLVIVNASVESGALVALDQEQGREVWRADGMVESWSTPHLVELPNGQQELVVSVKDKILAFNPATGEPLWNCAGIPDYVCPSIISREGIVYAIGGRQSRAIAIRGGGRGDVTDTHKLWEARAGANVSSPVLQGDYLYWVSDRNRNAYCLRAADGEIVYQERFPEQPYASTVAADGKLYVVTRHGGTYVLAAKPVYEVLAHNEFDSDNSTFNASPAIANGQILIRSDRYLYSIGK